MRIAVVEADHEANAFWTLTEDAIHEAAPEKVFAALPERTCGNPATHDESCFLVDLHAENGDLVDTLEVTEAIAQHLLDEPISVARERFRTMLWECYGATG